MTEQKTSTPVQFSKEDIVFSRLEETRYEEYTIAVHDWYASLPENRIPCDFDRGPRLTVEQVIREKADGTNIIIGCIKTTNEMIGSIAVGRPKYSVNDRLTGNISLFAVKTDYRRSGLGLLLYEQCIRNAKLAGAERITLEVQFDNKIEKRLLLGYNFVHTATRTIHKSDLCDNLFIIIREYLTLDYFEKYI